MLLEQLAATLEPASIAVSSFGIREGLLYSELPKPVRALDPLVEAARDAGGAERRFGEHGDLLDSWIGRIFDDPPPLRRIRLVSCLLADVAWQASPDFRADRAVEMALHGNWVGLSPAERVIIAQALSSSFGRDKLPGSALSQLCGKAELQRAQQWGVAMRLAQRLCGGVGAALAGTALNVHGKVLELRIKGEQKALIGEQVERRLARLADCLGMTAAVQLQG
jgi:exopolyphosphatase/guanosine-5'-triphosphate,3'-diphosphate pyrophosphatase